MLRAQPALGVERTGCDVGLGPPPPVDRGHGIPVGHPRPGGPRPYSPFAADDGDSRVASTATTTYQVVPAKGYVAVTVVQKITNHTPARRRPTTAATSAIDPYTGPYEVKRTCHTTTRYYYYQWSVVTEAERRTSMPR